jgi:hypothetical protein
MDEELSPTLPDLKNPKLILCLIALVIAAIILRHNLAFRQKSTIVLPAGGTYLGPKDAPSEAPQPAANTVQPITNENKFTVSADTPWVTVKGNVYPYSLQSPKTLNLVTLPGENKYDIYAISWNGQPPDQNVLIGVDNLNNTESSKQYITISKRSYVDNWYKQFGLKGISSVTEFTNSKGLKGYRAIYINASGQTPDEDVFFEVANPADVIHMARNVLSDDVFNKIIDSVAWEPK